LFVGMAMSVCLLSNPMYIYILLAHHNLGGTHTKNSINIVKTTVNITNDNSGLSIVKQKTFKYFTASLDA